MGFTVKFGQSCVRWCRLRSRVSCFFESLYIQIIFKQFTLQDNCIAEISSLNSQTPILKSSNPNCFHTVGVRHYHSASFEGKEAAATRFNPYENRRLLQTCKEQQPQRRGCDDGSFITTGQCILIKRRAKSGMDGFSQLLIGFGKSLVQHHGR